MDVTFKEVSEFDMIDLTFKVKDGQLLVKGSDDAFVSGSEEYDKIYVDSTGIYDDDEVLIATDKVRIGDSDTYLELGSIKIGKLEIKLDMSDILYDGISFAGAEENFLDYLGIIFKDPENAVEDQSGFEVSVPEERPEVTITFSAGIQVVVPEPPVVTPPVEPEPIEPEPVEPTEPLVVVPPPVVEPDEPDVPPVVPPVTPDDDTDKWGDKLFEQLLTLVGILLTALGVQWKRGILGIVRYHWKAGRKAQAMKTLFTLAKRAKEDYYKKKG